MFRLIWFMLKNENKVDVFFVCEFKIWKHQKAQYNRFMHKVSMVYVYGKLFLCLCGCHKLFYEFRTFIKYKSFHLIILSC